MEFIKAVARPRSEAFATGLDVRLACRTGSHVDHTSGLAPGYAQGNLVMLPRALADDFRLFCERNPKACPLLAVGAPGDVDGLGLAADCDLRTDLPRYRVWRDGALVDEPTDVRALWREDLVIFVIGCSFTFEEALLADGVPLRHVREERNVAMFRTSVETTAAGPFGGPLVVSMRPMRPADAIRAVEITSRYPAVHGAPVHIGLPRDIGVDDLAAPDYGEAVAVAPDELPVFWACGVTPQAAIERARPPFAITHAPGCMIVTDRLNRDYAT